MSPSPRSAPGPGGSGPRAPPIWIGGHSAGALRRAVRFGDAWHPSSLTAAWLTGVGLPGLRWIADDLGLPVPALAPRIKLRVSDRRIGGERLLGEGTRDQIRGDIALLAELGAESVVLDPTFPGEARTRWRTEEDLAALEMFAADIADLEHQCLR